MAPSFAGQVDVAYVSSTSSVATGPELPAAPGVINELQVWSTDQTVTLGVPAQVNGTLTLSNGVLDNSGATLTLADGVEIRRGSGNLVAAPAFAGTVDVDYISTSNHVTTGPELPIGAAVLADLTVSGDQGVTLGADATVNGACTISGSVLATDAYTLTLGATATLNETDGLPVLGTVVATRTVVQSVNETFGGIGLEIDAGGAAPGATTVTRTTGSAQYVDGADGILRSFALDPANNAGLDATLVFHYDDSELNGLEESALGLFGDYGSSWTKLGASLDAAANTLTVAGESALGDLTAAKSIASPVGDNPIPLRTEITSVYPNPFNPAARISLSLAKTGPVDVAVFDIKGRRIRTLKSGVLQQGEHELTWRGQDDSGQSVASGVYFCRMVADSRIRTEKMLLAQ